MTYANGRKECIKAQLKGCKRAIKMRMEDLTDAQTDFEVKAAAFKSHVSDFNRDLLDRAATRLQRTVHAYNDTFQRIKELERELEPPTFVFEIREIGHRKLIREVKAETLEKARKLLDNGHYVSLDEGEWEHSDWEVEPLLDS